MNTFLTAEATTLREEIGQKKKAEEEARFRLATNKNAICVHVQSALNAPRAVLITTISARAI